LEYSNYSKARQCTKEDFAEMGEEEDFLSRTKEVNNFYCPEGNYKDVRLRI
jgi:hypothetical protein